MLIIEMLLKTLLITKCCLSLTIHQPSYLNYRGHGNSAAALNAGERQTSLPQIVHGQGNGIPSKYARLSQITPYQAGAISNILSQTTTTSLNYRPPDYTNIYPVQYQFNNQFPKTHTVVANEQQPVSAASLESEILHATKRQPTSSSVNYDNKIYHINTHKRASPLANNEQEKPTFIVRKQRILGENHDDKLIEQNNKQIQDRNDVNDRQYAAIKTAAAAASSSSKQPSSKESSRSSLPTTNDSSHETRYFHDIFLNYPKSHHVNAGHVELSPHLFEKRFESQKAGNRYKGEVLWLDNTGGFAQHYWDLAQGKL